MTLTRAAGLTIALSILAACSGGSTNLTPARNSATTAPVGGGPTSTNATARVTATIILPRKKAGASKAGKTRKYVSPATLGLIIEVDTIPNNGFATPYSYTAYDLTQNSTTSQCTSSESSTTCTISLDAPVTSSSSSDAFYIYAYDQPQTPAGTITASYMPSGNLLSEDKDDLVPSAANGENPSGISTNINNVLSFNLGAVVAEPEVSYGSAEAAPLGTTPIVLSVSGDAATNGTEASASTSPFNVDGYDYDDDEIAAYANTSSYYINPILSSVSVDSNQNEQVPPTFAIQAAVGTSKAEPAALNTHARVGTKKRQSTGSTVDFSSNLLGSSPAQDTGYISYTPGSSDAPIAETSTVPAATVTFESSFTGGFGDENTTPTTTYNEVDSSFVVAPMYAFVDSGASSAIAGNSGYIYAIASQAPTDAGYTLTPASGDCSGYTIGANTGTLQDDQQAQFPVSLSVDTGDGSSCVLTLSDGMSNDTITLSPPASSTTTITIPNSVVRKHTTHK